MALPIAGFAHVNLNCSRLGRSKAFYERVLGLRALVHTNPAAQDCSAFGLRAPGQWDAWMLGHTEPGAGCALDLLEWLRPRPLALPDVSPGRLGLRALGFDLARLTAASGRLRAAGGRVEAGPAPVRFAAGPAAATLLASDPDGNPLWLRQGARDRLAFVELGCSRLERSMSFYREVLGLEAVSAPARSAFPLPRPRAALAWRAAALTLPGDASGFRVALTAWERPRGHARPTAEPHRKGLFRMALLTGDIARAHCELRGLGVAGLSDVADLDLGPACPAPRCRAVFFRDPDGACLELIEVPAAPASAPPPRAPA